MVEVLTDKEYLYEKQLRLGIPASVVTQEHISPIYLHS